MLEIVISDDIRILFTQSYEPTKLFLILRNYDSYAIKDMPINKCSPIVFVAT